MKDKKIRFGIAIGLVLFILIVVGLVFVFAKDETTSSKEFAVVKENVYVISSESKDNLIPSTIEENRMLFTENPEYAEGDVIVSGITEQAPNGFIRKVVSLTFEENNYVVVTEPAFLTDVFEEAHFKRTITLLDDGAKIVYNENLNAHMLQSDIAKDLLKQMVDNDTDYQFAAVIEDESDNEMDVNGVVGYNIVLEIAMDIEEGEIELSMLTKQKNAGVLTVGYNGEIEHSKEKELFSKNLPNIQFFVGTIPIVVTNEIKSDFEAKIKAEGKMETSFELMMENVAGFKYDSKTTEVTEIKELNYLSDGITWETEAQAGVENSVGVSFHLISKLYDSTGADIAIGLEGKATGEVVVEPVELSYIGSMDLAIEPSIQGSIVVTVPIVDEKLADKPMFVVELPALWEKHWESGYNWKEMLNSLVKKTYITRYSDINVVDAPEFQFDFPKNWTITKEFVNDGSNPYQVCEEIVELTNERGVTIRYVYGGRSSGQGRDVMTCDIVKVEDSNLELSYVQATDYSEQNPMVVAKIHNLTYGDVTGQYVMEWDKYIYAVIPESYLDIKSYGDCDEWGINRFSFKYGGVQSFIAHSPDGKFTREEEKEIIEILSSFRELDYSTE